MWFLFTLLCQQDLKENPQKKKVLALGMLLNSAVSDNKKDCKRSRSSPLSTSLPVCRLQKDKTHQNNNTHINSKLTNVPSV